MNVCCSLIPFPEIANTLSVPETANTLKIVAVSDGLFLVKFNENHEYLKMSLSFLNISIFPDTCTFFAINSK